MNKIFGKGKTNMENNYVNLQPQIDPGYEEKAKSFLTKAIVACAISAMPIGSIVAIVLGSNNRAQLMEYLSQGGPHTVKLKVSSALSRAGKYAGIGYTIFWAVYILYFIFVIGAIILGAAASSRR